MNKLPNCHSESKGDEKETMGKIQKPFSNHHDHDPDPPKPQDPVTMQNSAIATLPQETFFPFFQLSGEIRNQIYLDILGPQLPRPIPEEPAGGKEGEFFWIDRQFNVALFLVSKQISREFSDNLWDNLGVEWHIDTFVLDPEETLRFFSMKYLQRCKLILHSSPSFTYAASRRFDRRGNIYDITVSAIDVELTTFGLGHRLSRMSHLKQMHLEYHESEDSWEDGYWVRYRDGSLVQHMGNDLKTVFSDGLRGIKLVHVSGTLCDECAALVASAIERPREILPEEYQQEPEKCIPRATVPLWEDKSRRWV
ncbi:MAG: hypothetical protein L6R37_002544 [Teloschistes peruensis]|nr:MAG: hypothetical protein L6R37_002544 [Teloschistes peruensis]